MFEENIERIRQILVNKLNLKDKYLYLSEILKNHLIEHSYKKYFEGEIKWIIFQEQNSRKFNRLFDYNIPEIAEISDKFDELCLENARFDYEYLNIFIDSSVKVRLNMLCRPNNTLIWFIYRGESIKSINEISLRLEFFGDYHYLVDGIKDWINRLKTGDLIQEPITINDFRTVIQNIERNFIEKLSPNEFFQLLIPLYEFFNIDEIISEESKIPIESLIIFFDDKGIYAIAEKLNKLIIENHFKNISGNSLKKLLISTTEEFEEIKKLNQEEIILNFSENFISDIKLNIENIYPENNNLNQNIRQFNDSQEDNSIFFENQDNENNITDFSISEINYGYEEIDLLEENEEEIDINKEERDGIKEFKENNENVGELVTDIPDAELEEIIEYNGNDEINIQNALIQSNFEIASEIINNKEDEKFLEEELVTELDETLQDMTDNEIILSSNEQDYIDNSNQNSVFEKKNTKIFEIHANEFSEIKNEKEMNIFINNYCNEENSNNMYLNQISDYNAKEKFIIAETESIKDMVILEFSKFNN